jgi:YD repeat-containing protein
VSLWKAVDRDRDANTGLIQTSRDSAGVATAYTYDGLGRVQQIAPTGEDSSNVDYVSLLQTTVTQGTGGDFIQTVYNYDGLGRMLGVAKRSYSPDVKGYSCQTSASDVDGRSRFKSEWFFVASPNFCVPDEAHQYGAHFQYTQTQGGVTTSDPFGRVRAEIHFDGSMIGTSYFGTSSTVTHEVSGIDGIPSIAETVFYRDGRNRLINVHRPRGSRCSLANTVCQTDDQCGTGELCVAVIGGGGDASYGYDAADRLTSVDLDLENGQSQSRRFFYDGLGHTVHTDNPENGTVVSDRYDALGHPLRTQDAAGNVHLFSYDFAGRPFEDILNRPGISGDAFN